MVQHAAEVPQEAVREKGAPLAPPGVRAIAVLALLLVALYSLYRQSPPAAVGAAAPAAEFSSARAFEHLKVIAGEPHPVGSAAQAPVREHLVKALEAAGQPAEVQRATVVKTAWNNPYRVADVQNVVTRLKGTGGTGAVLLMAHYDSAPGSHGASDDGAAVATLLETVRALKSGPPLKNDVIFLFTDAEEVGLLGAQGFADRHPWAKDVKVVVNFEARGNRGPVYMFETSDDNGWLVEGFAAAAEHPSANSLMYDIYRLLPHDSDLSVFKGGGVASLNFAHIGGPSYYHAQLDDLQRVDERSLQHQGSYALGLARHFGGASLEQTRRRNEVYFDIFGAKLVHYSYAFAIPALALVVLLFAAVLYVGFRRGHLTRGGLLGGFGIFLGAILASSSAVGVTWIVVKVVHGGYALMTLGDTYNSWLYQAAFAALAVAVTAGVYALVGRGVKAQNLLAGALLWWVIFAALSVALLPGGSYLFTWPLLFVLPGLCVWFASEPREGIGARAAALLAAGAVPGVILFAPLVKLLFDGLTLRMAAVVVVPLVLLLGLVVPHLSWREGARRWALPALAALVAAGFIAAGSATAGFTPEQRRPNQIAYGLDADSGRAFWVSPDEWPDEWTSQFFGAKGERGPAAEIFPLGKGIQYLKKDAPAAGLAAPEIEVLEDRTHDGVRSLRLLVKSPRNAPVVTLYEESESDILSVAVKGEQLQNSKVVTDRGRRRVFALRYFALPPEGVEVSLDVWPEQPLKLRLVDQSYGLPGTEAVPVKARPDYMMPAVSPYGDAAFVAKTFQL